MFFMFSLSTCWFWPCVWEWIFSSYHYHCHHKLATISWHDLRDKEIHNSLCSYSYRFYIFVIHILLLLLTFLIFSLCLCLCFCFSWWGKRFDGHHQSLDENTLCNRHCRTFSPKWIHDNGVYHCICRRNTSNNSISSVPRIKWILREARILGLGGRVVPNCPYSSRTKHLAQSITLWQYHSTFFSVFIVRWMTFLLFQTVHY
jgi:hypothetical protein